MDPSTASNAKPLKRFRQHQVKMFKYAMEERHPFLAVEMRLGKNLVVIRRCKLYKPLDPALGLKILIVAPNSALGSWEEELKNEQETKIVSVSEGSRCLNVAALSRTDGKWYLTNKETFLSVPEISTAQNWDAAIFDESVWISNPKAKITKFYTNRFRDCPHRWALAGIPAPESILQLWSQLAWLDGHAFSYRNFWDFRAQCFYQRGYDWVPKEDIESYIKRCFGARACIIRRKDYNLEPSKEKIVRTLELPPALRKQYDEIETNFSTEDGNSTVWSVVQYQWLRALTSAVKIDELLAVLALPELHNEPIVVWFHYNKEIEEASRALKKQGIPFAAMTGALDRQERETIRKDFIRKRYKVILIQQAIAQEGMDLSCSDTAIYYSCTPSLKAMRQTGDRIVSLSKQSNLLYIYLIVKDTVDHDLYTAIAGKNIRSDLDLSKALKLGLEERIRAKRFLRRPRP